MKTVLNMLELENRINPENIHTYEKIVYKNINTILEEKRKKDLELLRSLTHNIYER